MSFGFSSWIIITEPQFYETEVKVDASDALGLLKLNSTTGFYNICKYGFVDNNDQILSSCTYSYNCTFYQLNARNSGYIVNDKASFYINISDKTSNSFILLATNSYFDCAFYITYGGSDTIKSTFSLNNQILSSNVDLSNINSNDTSEITFNVLLTFNSGTSSNLETALNSFSYDKGLGFNAEIGIKES